MFNLAAVICMPVSAFPMTDYAGLYFWRWPCALIHRFSDDFVKLNTSGPGPDFCSEIHVHSRWRRCFCIHVPQRQYEHGSDIPFFNVTVSLHPWSISSLPCLWWLAASMR